MPPKRKKTPKRDPTAALGDTLKTPKPITSISGEELAERISRVGDIQLAVLRYHVVAHGILLSIISARLAGRDDELPKRLGFMQSAAIALCGLDEPKLLATLQALDSARNELSHTVDMWTFFEKLRAFMDERGVLAEFEASEWPHRHTLTSGSLIRLVHQLWAVLGRFRPRPTGLVFEHQGKGLFFEHQSNGKKPPSSE